MPILPAPLEGEQADQALVAGAIDAPPVLPAAIPVSGGNLTPEQLALASIIPKPPAVTPLDTQLAQLPADTSPIVPPAAVVPPKSPDEAAAGNLEAATKLGEDKVKIAEEKAALDTRLATEKAEFQKGYNEHFLKLQGQQELHRQDAEHHVTEVRAKAESEPYHSLWDTRTTGEKVAIALGLLVGGVSWNANHVNRGAQMLESTMKANDERQKLKHADLWKAVDEAQQGVRDLNSGQLRELSVFNAVEGAKWDRISSQLGALIAANKGRSDVSEAKKQALDAAEKATLYWQNSIHAAAQASHQTEQDKERARHDLEMEKARAKKSGGGGIGGGSSAQQKGAIEIREAIEKAKTEGKPLSDSQIARLAFDKKIPEVAKAGRISLKTIMDDINKASNADAKTGNINVKHEEALDARTVRWNGKEYLAPRANQVKDIAKDIANSEKYQDLIREVANDIRKNGFIVDPGGTDNPQTEKGKRRMSIMAELQALGRQISGLQATDAGSKLEGQMIGHAGVGLKPGTASPDALTELGARAMKLINTKFGAMLTPREKAAAAGGESEGKWIPVPSYLSAKLPGKKEVQVNSAGDVIGAR